MERWGDSEYLLDFVLSIIFDIKVLNGLLIGVNKPTADRS